MRQPTIHQMREKKKSSRKSQGSRKVTICILCMGNIAERLLLASEGMLMLVLGQTEDIYYDFFQYK
jgi:hypothetical protein